ncbi:MAG: hypothetical protein ABIJ56_22285 [Pseudomonadota bacterium]
MKTATATILLAALLGACNGGGADSDGDADALIDAPADWAADDSVQEAAPDSPDVMTDNPDAPPDFSDGDIIEQGDLIEDAAEDAAQDALQDIAGEAETPPEFCPDIEGAVVFRMTDDFVPSPEEPTRSFTLPCEGGLVFGSVVIELDLTHGGWFEPEPDGTHGIFQFQRGTRWRSNLFGFMTMFGPPQNEVKVISNIDLGPGEVVRLNQRPARFYEGTTYHIRYTYDAAGSERRLVITDSDGEVINIHDDQTVGRVDTLDPGFDLILASADSGDEGPEVPSYGWVYDNVCIRVLP